MMHSNHAGGVLLTPGPVSVPPSVLAALAAFPELHHRSQAFSSLLQSIENGLRSAFRVGRDYEIALLGSSGTGMTEAMLRLAATWERPRILILVNGHFGERLVGIARHLGLAFLELRAVPGQAFDLDQVDSCLARNPDIGSVAMVHMETSLGQFNEASSLAALVRSRGVRLCVDAVSSLAGEPWDFQSFRPDVAVSVSGKALRSFPGVGMAFLSSDCLAEGAGNCRDHYFNLRNYVAFWAENRSLPFTPPIALFPPLNEAVGLVVRDGLEQKISQHRECLRELERFFVALGFSPVTVARPSCTTRTFVYSAEREGFFDQVHAAFARNGCQIYQNPYYHRPQRCFQVSTMGCMDALPGLLERMRAEVTG